MNFELADKSFQPTLTQWNGLVKVDGNPNPAIPSGNAVILPGNQSEVDNYLLKLRFPKEKTYYNRFHNSVVVDAKELAARSPQLIIRISQAAQFLADMFDASNCEGPRFETTELPLGKTMELIKQRELWNNRHQRSSEGKTSHLHNLSPEVKKALVAR